MQNYKVILSKQWQGEVVVIVVVVVVEEEEVTIDLLIEKYRKIQSRRTYA